MKFGAQGLSLAPNLDLTVDAVLIGPRHNYQLSLSLIHIILNSADGSFVERPFYGVQYIVVSPILLYARAICINLTIVSLRFIP